MRPTLTATALPFSVLLAVAMLATLPGRTSAGPAGRSYSSGGSSFSGGKSASAGGGKSSSTPAGRSYSSGGKTSPAVPSGGKTAPVPPPAGKAPPAAPAAAKPSPPAAGKASPAAAPAPTKPSAPPPAGKPSPAPPPAPGRDASLGGAPRTNGRAYSASEPPPAPAGAKPGATGYDAAAGAAQRRQESKEAYTRGTQPKPSYTDGKGRAQAIDPKDARIDQLRRQLDEERWVNRRAREQQYFAPYSTRPVIVYHDPYNSFFWWWLLDQSLDQRALWAYNHQADMDRARYQDLLARDRLLEAKVRELEARNLPRDPTYAPPGLDPDLAYTDDYVKAAYNPQPQPQPQSQPQPPPPPRHGNGMILLTTLMVLLLVGAVVWMVFFKRWGVS